MLIWTASSAPTPRHKSFAQPLPFNLNHQQMDAPHSLDHIRQVLAEYFADKPVQRVQIFGSYARGEATAESDLDVLLSREPGSRMTLFDLMNFQDDLERRLGLRVDLGTALSPFARPHIEPDLLTVYEQAA